MTQVTLAEAQQSLPELLAKARGGEIVEILEDGWAYRLEPESLGTGTPKAGSCKGLIWMSDDFNAPLELRESEQ